MPSEEKLRDPWLLAVWPGMGGVALSAGYYLMAKLGMHLLAEFPAVDYFDLEHVEVKDGLILNKRLPRSRLFLWEDPKKAHDLIVFIGEAQPATRGATFCKNLIQKATGFGVSKVFTFAAMATAMRPKNDSRVFGAAIDRETLATFKKLGVEILESGNISGLNGVMLGMSAVHGLPGGCLLGEIPHVFSQIPFPKASLSVLRSFSALTGIQVDLDELQDHAKTVEETLEMFLVRMEGGEEESRDENHEASADGDGGSPAPNRERQHIERLFEEARNDRSRAYVLKQELDRLGWFNEYEDRFLDLFK